MKKPPTKAVRSVAGADYVGLMDGIGELLEAARSASVRVTNSLMTATYWEVGRRIVEFEQGGKKRAEYGEELLEKLSRDLTSRFGRGFGVDNLENMRRFYMAVPENKISGTLSRKSVQKTSGESSLSYAVVRNSEMSSRNFSLDQLAAALPLPWSHYVALIKRARSAEAFDFYHAEALRGGWTGPQLDRQINWFLATFSGWIRWGY